MNQIDWMAPDWLEAFAELRNYLRLAIKAGVISEEPPYYIKEFIDKGFCSAEINQNFIGNWALKNIADWSEPIGLSPDISTAIEGVVKNLKITSEHNIALIRHQAAC